MPKLNAALMVVLTLAVIAATGFLVLGKPADLRAEDAARTAKLLRKLADNDPDLRRDAESEIRALGSKAAPILRQAALSPDPALASRAGKLLLEIAPVRTVEAAAPGPPAREPVSSAEPAEPLEFRIEGGGDTFPSGEPLRVYVRLVNQGPAPVVLARDQVLRYFRFARFEVVDPKEEVRSLPTEPAGAPAGSVEFVVVKPGETFDLFAGQGDGRTSVGIVSDLPGEYRVRFVYEASEGSAYRAAVREAAQGLPLPPRRMESNVLTVRRTD